MMSEDRDRRSDRALNHLALGLCLGTLVGLVLTNIALGILLGIAFSGMLDLWHGDNGRMTSSR